MDLKLPPRTPRPRTRPERSAPAPFDPRLHLFYHADRIHDSPEKDTPAGRAISKPVEFARLLSFPRLGGLHHRYDWQQAA